MKAYRLVLAFSVVALTIVAIAWIFGLINGTEMFDFSGRLLGIVILAGICGVFVFAILNPGSKPSRDETRRDEYG